MTPHRRFLAIESSSASLSLAVGTDKGVLHEWQGKPEWRHAESLFEGMEALLKKVGWPVQSLKGVAVSVGPGSFTGIRIGLAAARALGQSLEIPVVGVSSLKIIAAGMGSDPKLKYNAVLGSDPKGACYAPLVNALRGDVFTALYHKDKNGRLKIVWPECRWPIDQFINRLIKVGIPCRRVLLAGDALPLYQKELQKLGSLAEWGMPSDVYPRAGSLLQLALPKFIMGHKSSYKKVLPLYLRDAAAKERQKSKV